MEWSTVILKRLKRKTSGGAYLPELDGLRFIAIFLVLVQHLSERLLKYGPDTLLPFFRDSETAYWAGRGTSGVFLFFTISGFILALPLIQKAQEERLLTSLRTYFQRRLTRLEPPYILWMSLFALVLWYQGSWSSADLFGHWLASIFYVHNLMFGTYSIINPVAWSLEVEIQFYLLAPAIAWFFFSRLKRRQNLFLLVSITLLFILQHIVGMDIMPWKASIFNSLQYFLLGFLLANGYRQGLLLPLSQKKYPKLCWDLLGLFALIALYVFWSEDLWKEALFLLGIAVFFLAAFRGSLIRKFLRLPLISTLGGMCYTVYLVHLPLLEAITPWTATWFSTTHYFWYLLVQVMICVPLIFLFSALAFWAFERPFMDQQWPAQLRLLLQQYFTKNSNMNKPAKSKVLWGLIFLLLPLLGLAQNERSPIIDANRLQLQPLPALVRAAMENAPGLKIQDYKMDNRAEQMRLIRKDWLNNFQFAGNVLLNNGLYMDAIETINSNAYSLTNRRNVAYNVGLVFRLPAAQLTNRSNQLKIEQNELQIERLRKDELQSEITNAVTELYEEIRLQQEMLRIRTESLETYKLALKLAETYFEQGEESLEGYSRAISQKTRAEEELAQTKNRLLMSVLILEELCGRKVIIE